MTTVSAAQAAVVGGAAIRAIRTLLVAGSMRERRQVVVSFALLAPTSLPLARWTLRRLAS